MNKIVLWYDSKTKNNCNHARVVYESRTILEKLDKINYEYQVKVIGDFFNQNDINLYVIELRNVFDDFDIFSLIPTATKNLFKQNLSIILYYPKEGHALDDWLVSIYNNLLKNNLLETKIYLVYGDTNIEENYNTILKNLKIDSFLTPIPFDYFLGDYIENTGINSNINLNSEKKYNFLFYNGKLRPHRLFAVSELARRNLLKGSLVSLMSSSHPEEEYDFNSCLTDLREHDCCTPYIENFVKKFKPLILDDGNNQQKIYLNNLSHYESTYFSIVSETIFTNVFITEKTYKTIYNCHPYIIIGAPGILNMLRKKGFYTFGELFDESYDNEKDHPRRVKMIIDQVENFCRLPQEEKEKKISSIKDKILYNKNHYIKIAKNSTEQEFTNMFEILRKNHAYRS